MSKRIPFKSAFAAIGESLDPRNAKKSRESVQAGNVKKKKAARKSQRRARRAGRK